jgi:hypothetical protein
VNNRLRTHENEWATRKIDPAEVKGPPQAVDVIEGFSRHSDGPLAWKPIQPLGKEGGLISAKDELRPFVGPGQPRTPAVGRIGLAPNEIQSLRSDRRCNPTRSDLCESRRLDVDDPKIAIIASHNSGFVGPQRTAGRTMKAPVNGMSVIGLYQRRLAGAEPSSASTLRRDFAADLLQMQQQATTGTRCDCGRRERIGRALWSRGAEKISFWSGLESSRVRSVAS